MEYRLEEIAMYSNKKIEIDKINFENYISTENMLPNKLGITKATTLPNQSKVNFFEKQNILISNIRPYFKKIWFADFSGGCSNDVLNIVVKDSINVLPKFLYYNLFRDEFFKYVMSGNKGTKMPRGDKHHIMQYIINIPNIEMQSKIVNILEKIDKKIELNNNLNDNLYEIMYLKFNKWVDSLEDYEISNLSSIANYKNGLAMQKYRPENEIGLPVIKIKEMNSGISNETERCRSDIAKDVIINDGDVLFAWSGTLCMSIWDNGKAGLNQHIFKVTSDKYPKWFYYFWTLKHLDKFIQIATGKATTMGHIKRGELDLSKVLIPNEKELNEMNEIMAPILDKYIENKLESKTLVQLRDTLLPKLMNGEIDLYKIEI